MTYISQIIKTNHGTCQSHVGLPIIIRKPGKYQTRSGETVTVKSIERHWADGEYENGIKESWYTNGRIFHFAQSENDIVSFIS